MAFGKLGAMGRGFGTLGALGRAGTTIGPKPGTPVLTWTSVATDLTPEGTITFDNVPVAGDTLTSQIQTAGGDWSSPVLNNSHTITSGEDLVNEVDLVNTAIPAGSYDWRVRITHNSAPSDWSNTQTKTLTSFTPASLTPNAWFEPAKGGLFKQNNGTSGSTSATANTDAVAFLPDQSGNGFNVMTVTTTLSPSDAPTLQGVGVNPYLSFDGVNDLLRRTSGLGGTGTWAAGAGSWFLAIQAPTPAATAFMAGEYASGNGCTYCPFESQGTFSSISGQARNDAAGSITGFFNNIIRAGAFDGTDHVIGVVDNGSTLTGYVDGVAAAAISYTRGANTITATLFALGGRMASGTPGNWFAHRMYGSVFVNRVLTGAEIANLTTYLGNLQGRTI